MSNLDLAQEAYQYSVGRLQRYGSDNKRLPEVVLDGRTREAEIAEERRVGRKMAMVKLKESQPLRGSPMASVIAYGRTVLTAQAGNCFEHAAAACAYLDAQRPRPAFDIVRMPELDHAFVVIGQTFPAADGEYPPDFGTWDVGAAICDGWAEIFCRARDYPQQWRNRMDIWNAAGLQVPHGTIKGAWTSAINYKDSVENEVKESYTWRRSRCCCFITTATCGAFGLPDDCHELETLRWYRDQVMLVTPQGRADVARYYELAPAIVRAIDLRPDAQRIYRDLYHRVIAPAVEAVVRGDEHTPYRLFARMIDDGRALLSASGPARS